MFSSLKSLFEPKRSAWYSWDFGTQILMVNASVYFSEWLVVDNHVPDLWYSLTFIASTIVLIFASPYLGVVLDGRGQRRKTFFWLTGLTLGSGVVLQLSGYLSSFGIKIALALVSYALLNLFYQLASFVFNTFLKDISNEKDVGKVSGIGAGFSTIGDALGLLVTLPIILGTVVLFGTSRISVMIPAALLAGIFCLPMYLAFRSQKDAAHGHPVPHKYKQIWRDLLDTKSYPGVARLLLAYCFYNDAILTLQLFAAIYLDKVYHIPDSGKVVIIMIVYLAFTLGAWGGGYLGDKWGNKRGLMAGILFTALAVAAIAFANPGFLTYVLFGSFGLGTGVTFSNTKALFTKLIPYEKKAEFFGIYAIFERFASIIGPAAWGLIVYFVSSKSGLNYRAAVLAMSLFLLLGGYVASKVREA